MHPLAVPGHNKEGHHDGMVCLSEWKSFFAWASEHGEGEEHLTKAEKAVEKMQDFNERVEDSFKAMDADHSGELSLPEMERIFGEETHEFWEDMDGETREECSVSSQRPVGVCQTRNRFVSAYTHI